jgi:NAD(P)-dependent dehydrogenase (short-subunit alcohol dehydrogenase family)
MTTKTVLITGATSGLGREVARTLADHGLHVLVHGRDISRTEAFTAELRATGAMAQPYVADFASLKQVRELADQVVNDYQALHILVNNAGIGAGPPPHTTRELSQDGYELRFAINYLATVLLTQLLVPLLVAGAPARIVNVGSTGQAPVDFADPQLERGYSGAEAYFRSKFALATFTFTLADKLRANGITVNCVHPASFMDTAMVRESGIGPWTTASAGVPPVLNLAIESAGTETGRYFEGSHHKRAHRATYEDIVRTNLATLTNQLLGAPTARSD